VKVAQGPRSGAVLAVAFAVAIMQKIAQLLDYQDRHDQAEAIFRKRGIHAVPIEFRER
jgi:hypothetical protein